MIFFFLVERLSELKGVFTSVVGGLISPTITLNGMQVFYIGIYKLT